MKHSIKVGLSFGLTSGVITVLGVLMGLNSSTHSQMIVLGGILIVAVSDAFSDALGIHLSEESEGIHTPKEIWQSTVSTFIFKFIVSLSFVVPFLFLALPQAVLACVIWGALLLAGFSFFIAKSNKANPFKVVIEHLFVAAFVVVTAYYLGCWINSFFING